MQHQLDWLDAHDAATCIHIVFPFAHHKSSEGSTSSHVTSLSVWRAESEQQHGRSGLLLLLIWWSIADGLIPLTNRLVGTVSNKPSNSLFFDSLHAVWVQSKEPIFVAVRNILQRTWQPSITCTCGWRLVLLLVVSYLNYFCLLRWRIEIWAIPLELDICLFSCSRYQDDLFTSMELVSLQLHFSM